MKSPLCFPVRLQGQTIYVLDETRLPLEETNLEVKSLEDALEVLGQMKTRAFGQVLLFLYTCALTDEIEGIAAAFKKIRPTFDFFTLADVLKGVTKKTATLSDAVASIVEDIDSKRKVRSLILGKPLLSLSLKHVPISKGYGSLCGNYRRPRFRRRYCAITKRPF
jgi:methylthioribose-1-phosphate isomerase